jgi:serine/threonine protein kinase
VIREGAIPPVEALEIAAQICRALTSAHASGFIHRDIKPQNVLLAAAGGIKLTDFGIARISESTSFTTSGIVLGTADYISPEQAQGLSLTPSTDLYALGVVLFEMLTGVLPFQGPSVVAVAMLHTTKAPPSLRMLNPALPHRLERLVRRALAKKPEQRFRSAAEMGRVLLHEADILRKSSPEQAPQDAEMTRVLKGRELRALSMEPAATEDVSTMDTVVTPMPPSRGPDLPNWNTSLPNGDFGPPEDPWGTETVARDASLPSDIVDAYLFTEANVQVSVARPRTALSNRTALVLLVCAVILLLLLLPRLI